MRAIKSFYCAICINDGEILNELDPPIGHVGAESKKENLIVFRNTSLELQTLEK